VLADIIKKVLFAAGLRWRKEANNDPGSKTYVNGGLKVGCILNLEVFKRE
jgi:hypothetical protein